MCVCVGVCGCVCVCEDVRVKGVCFKGTTLKANQLHTSKLDKEAKGRLYTIQRAQNH